VDSSLYLIFLFSCTFERQIALGVNQLYKTRLTLEMTHFLPSKLKPRITAIYNHYVKNLIQVAELKLTTIRDWLNFLQRTAREKLAFLVTVLKSSDATRGDNNEEVFGTVRTLDE
jgi:hypothetical protein